MKINLEQAQRARRSLEKVRRKLLDATPEAVELSAADLQEATECLEQVRLALGRPRPEATLALQLELAQVRRALRLVNALLANAGKFYEGWARLASTSDEDTHVNYTAVGKPSGSSPSRTGVVVHG